MRKWFNINVPLAFFSYKESLIFASKNNWLIINGCKNYILII